MCKGKVKQLAGDQCKMIYSAWVSQHTWVKDVKMSASKEMYKSDFVSIESTLNVSKMSTFKVSNKFLENKMSKFGWNNVTLSFSVTQFMQKFKQHAYSDVYILKYLKE